MTSQIHRYVHEAINTYWTRYATLSSSVMSKSFLLHTLGLPLLTITLVFHSTLFPSAFSNELRTILVESGRDDPVLSGNNQENDKILISDRGGGNNNHYFPLSNRTNLYGDPVHQMLSSSNGVVRMQNRKVSEHIGPDGRFKSSICDQPNGFLRKQRSLCLQYIQLMESVVRGYFMGLRECEYQFASHRWNCLGYNLTIRNPPTRRKSGKVLRSSQDERSNRKRVRTYMDRLLSSGMVAI
ncbi:unnamed protein product [Rodentolepis nana]|uniref:Protein Wnt n=1 Tax=Rodentolepis nana TaxID=102285 RepID=A0A0R3T6C5_RODNA|nr:unnamed protein product [Rodentolepis nana]